MKKLYHQNELLFSFLWILFLAAGSGLAESLREKPGILPAPAVFHLLLSLFLLLWIRRNGLAEKYGLCLPRSPLSRTGFFLPLLPVLCLQLCFGVSLQDPLPVSAFLLLSMLCAGFLEELLYRGFLFRALAGNRPMRSAVLSSLFFGLMHFLNLLNGQSPVYTCIQAFFAAAVGFTLAVLFLACGSLLPGMLFHGLFNAFSVLADGEARIRFFGGALPAALIPAAAGAALLLLYAFYLLKRMKKG